jgi:uncharacterized membrane protein YjjP (DUF1212 family)
MRFVVKAYQEVCADLMMMLEDIEATLEEITKAAELSDTQLDVSETELFLFKNQDDQ